MNCYKFEFIKLDDTPMFFIKYFNFIYTQQQKKKLAFKWIFVHHNSVRKVIFYNQLFLFLIERSTRAEI